MSYFFSTGITVVTPPKGTLAGGGRYFPRCLNKTLLVTSLFRNFAGLHDVPLSPFYLVPNAYDICLGKECMVYKRIDRTLLSCARPPDCFCEPESKWEDVPASFRAFNPIGSIPLPPAILGNVTIFSFTVPFGYDGMITAQFQQYTGIGLLEGSGDIIWRIRADGRYLRDCGNLPYTIGTSVQMSPIHGGLQVRSGNLVEYIVEAPNTSGSLPFHGTPGTNIVAGLHGYFYPRT